MDVEHPADTVVASGLNRTEHAGAAVPMSFGAFVHWDCRRGGFNNEKKHVRFHQFREHSVHKVIVTMPHMESGPFAIVNPDVPKISLHQLRENLTTTANTSPLAGATGDAATPNTKKQIFAQSVQYYLHPVVFAINGRVAGDGTATSIYENVRLIALKRNGDNAESMAVATSDAQGDDNCTTPGFGVDCAPTGTSGRKLQAPARNAKAAKHNPDTSSALTPN